MSSDADGASAKEHRRQRVLAAAADRLGSAAFDWRKGLTFDLLCQDTGLDRKTISKDFGSKRKLMDALVQYCLDPDNFDNFGEPWVADLLYTAAAGLLDPSVALFESIGEVGRVDFEYVRSDDRLRSQLAIWGLALDDAAARAAMLQMYRFYDSQHHDLWKRVAADLEDAGLESRSGISAQELVTVFTALVEGLAIRWHVDSEAVAPDLFGRVFATLVAALYEPRDDESEASIEGVLARIDDARRARDER